MKKRKYIILASAIATFLLVQTSLTFAAPVYIEGLSDFPAYAYNNSGYMQGGSYVGCGPTTGAMIFGYFEHHFSLTGLLANPVTGINEGLNTAWVLHSSDYMNTQANGYGSVYNIKPGLEGYASDRGFEINVMIHASTTYDPGSPSSDWLNEYGAYGDAWMNDGVFWLNDGSGNWDIDPDLFCDFVDDKLASGICIMLSVDTNGDGSGDHWIPCVGVDSDSDLYFFYDTYSIVLRSATIDYCMSPGAGDYALSFVRSITLTVDNQPPVLNPISGPDTCYRGDTVIFHVAGNDPDGDYPLYYEWFVNGYLMLEGEGEPTLAFVHTMDSWSVGENNVSVRVTDSRGAYAEVSKTWTTLNHAPTVSGISGPTSGYRGDAITFTATGADAEGDALAYEWYVDGTLASAGTSLTYTFGSSDTLGEHTVSVRVQDNIGDYSDYSTLTFNLNEARPIYCSFNVTYEEDVYLVETWSNSTVADLTFNATTKKISFNIAGTTGTESFCNITIPAELLSGDFTVFMDDSKLEEGVDYTLSSNSTHNTLSISYTHSSHIIDVFGTNVIPDFAGWLFLLFVVSATLLALAFKKNQKDD